jgi:hypothetical protein
MLQSIILNILAFLGITLAYSVILSIAQNVFAVLCGVLCLFSTRNLAKITSAIAATLASVIAILGASYVLFFFDKRLSLLTIILWVVLQQMGIARSFMGHKASVEEKKLVAAGEAEEGAIRMKYFGQFFGTILGAIIGITFTIQ